MTLTRRRDLTRPLTVEEGDGNIDDLDGRLSIPQVRQLSITHPSPAETVAVTGTGDQELDPAVYASSYVDVLSVYSSVESEGTDITVTADGRFEVQRDMIAKIEGYLDLPHNQNNATVGVVFSIERGVLPRILSPRAVHARKPNNSTIGNLSGVGLARLLAGDKVGIALASDTTGNVRLHTSSLIMQALDR